MKKTIKQTDGSEIVFEGTPSELIELEKELLKTSREFAAPSGKEEGKKPIQKILTDEIQRMLNQAAEEMKKGGCPGIFPKDPYPDYDPYRFPYSPPIPYSPWITNPVVPYRWTTTSDRIVKFDQPCMIEEFFKNHPDATSVGLVCPCPRCSIQCVATNGLPPYETASTAGTAYQVH